MSSLPPLSAASASPSPSSSSPPDISYIQANLQRAAASSDPRRFDTFYEQIRTKTPDFVFVQEVGEDFVLGKGLEKYKRIHIARTPKVTGQKSQLNVAVFQHADSLVSVNKVGDIDIERMFDFRLQRRKAVQLKVWIGSKIVTFHVVHADASDGGGRAMLNHFEAQVVHDPYYIGVGDINSDISKLGDKQLAIGDPFKRIAAPRLKNGNFAPTHVSVHYGTETFSSLDFAYHGDGTRIEYDEPVRSTFTDALSHPRAASSANATKNNLVDHFILSAKVRVVRGAGVQGAASSRTPVLRFKNLRPEDRAAAQEIKNALQPFTHGAKAFPQKREEAKRRKVADALTNFDVSGNNAAAFQPNLPSLTFHPGVSTPTTTRRSTRNKPGAKPKPKPTNTAMTDVDD